MKPISCEKGDSLPRKGWLLEATRAATCPGSGEGGTCCADRSRWGTESGGLGSVTVAAFG